MAQPATIAVLPLQVANQIAAGEVVERPASVVKELVENALDAGATRIEVRLRDGGREQIRIVDNGHGIAAEQAQLAFQRHATSKIRCADDLLRVASYGFRGEALASIASVAHVTMRTRTAAQELGVEVKGDGTGTFVTKPVAAPVGTDLSIDDLFATVPARRAFLRTAATELGHVIRWLDAQALARPSLHLSLHHNDRRVHVYDPRPNLFERAKQVLGGDVAPRLHEVCGDGDYSIQGAMAEPSLHRGSASGLTVLVDGRPVSDRTVAHAARQAYGNRLPARRHPVGVIALSCPAATVDVNVHPMKTEVRFLSKPAVHAAVSEAVEAMLDTGAWLAADDMHVPVTRKPARPRRPPSGRAPLDSGDLFGSRSHPSPTSRPPRPPTSARRPQPSEPRSAHDPSSAAPSHVATPGGGVPITSQVAFMAGDVPIEGRATGTVDGRFLLITGNDGLHAVDIQAAAAALGPADGRRASSRLMIPVLVRLGAPLIKSVVAESAVLARAGLEVAASPEGGLLVRAVPVGMPRSAAEGVIRAVAGGLLGGWQGLEASDRNARIDAAIAQQCPSSAAPMSIVSRLDGAQLPAATPDGRPIVVSRDVAAIQSWFSR